MLTPAVPAISGETAAESAAFSCAVPVQWNRQLIFSSAAASLNHIS